MSARRQTKKKTPQCCGKVTYPTQGKALSALKHIKIENAQAVVPSGTVEPRAAYRCLHGGWHLTAGRGVSVDG